MEELSKVRFLKKIAGRVSKEIPKLRRISEIISEGNCGETPSKSYEGLLNEALDKCTMEFLKELPLESPEESLEEFPKKSLEEILIKHVDLLPKKQMEKSPKDSPEGMSEEVLGEIPSRLPMDSLKNCRRDPRRNPSG